MYQVCPLCKGSGYDPTPGVFNSIPVCQVCDGKRIVSELTGKPPRDDKRQDM